MADKASTACQAVQEILAGFQLQVWEWRIAFFGCSREAEAGVVLPAGGGAWRLWRRESKRLASMSVAIVVSVSYQVMPWFAPIHPYGRGRGDRGVSSVWVEGAQPECCLAIFAM